ncbi:hypothetical protein GCK32_011878 [Trichostrongylus colubriformis]|uniref:Uncharacterized protein n=1 Tax=Trichostrongylus colubriformis TaxID=6319 RepID=A0AAN8EY23_TRICO
MQAIQNISNSLTNNGVFVAILPIGVRDFNPKREEGVKFGAAINLEPYTELYDGLRVDVESFDGGGIVGRSKVTFFFNETYERILRSAELNMPEKDEPLEPDVDNEAVA